MLNADPASPPFQFIVSTGGFLNDSEMQQLIADHATLLTQGGLGAGTADADVRRSHIAFLRNDPRYHWLYERVWDAAIGSRQSRAARAGAWSPGLSGRAGASFRLGKALYRMVFPVL